MTGTNYSELITTNSLLLTVQPPHPAYSYLTETKRRKVYLNKENEDENKKEGQGMNYQNDFLYRLDITSYLNLYDPKPLEKGSEYHFEVVSTRYPILLYKSSIPLRRIFSLSHYYQLKRLNKRDFVLYRLDTRISIPPSIIITVVT